MRWLAEVVVTAGVLAFAAPETARAGEKQHCVAASESAQELKNHGKLTEAREQLVICGQSTCPKLVQQDCTKWMSEVLEALPTIIPAAKDRRGRDIVDARVTVDGKVAAETFDGKPIAVDPGVHAMRFETSRAPAVEQQIVVRQGEKNRLLPVTFALSDGSDAAPPPPPPDETKDAAAPPAAHEVTKPPILGFALAGAGLVAGGIALYVGLAADGDGRNLRNTCAPHCAQSDVDDVQNRQNLAAYIGIGAGIVFAAGAALVIAHYVTSGSKGGRAALATWSLTPAPGGAATVLRF